MEITSSLKIFFKELRLVYFVTHPAASEAVFVSPIVVGGRLMADDTNQIASRIHTTSAFAKYFIPRPPLVGGTG